MTRQTDCASTVRALVQGKSTIAFAAGLIDAVIDVDRVATCTTPDHVAMALSGYNNSVSTSGFGNATTMNAKENTQTC